MTAWKKTLSICLFFVLTANAVQSATFTLDIPNMLKAPFQESQQPKRAKISPDFFKFPIFFGDRNSPNTVIYYFNSQCPESKKSWPEVTKLISRLNPKETKLIVQGSGYDSDGTAVVLSAIVLAIQNTNLACQYLTRAFTTPSAFHDPADWAFKWASKQSGFIPSRFDELYTDESDNYREAGRLEIKRKYGIKTVPTVIINGNVFSGKISEQSMYKILNSSTPYSHLP